MDAIRVDSIVKEYGNVRALDNASIVIEEGELFSYWAPVAVAKRPYYAVLPGWRCLIPGGSIMAIRM